MEEGAFWDVVVGSMIVVVFGVAIFGGGLYALDRVIDSTYTGETGAKTSEKYNASAEFTIENIDFVVSEDIGYNSYGRYLERTETIYIKSGRSLHKIKDTCEHEVLHYRGLDAEDSKDHEYIYRNQGNINSDICIRFIYELGKWNAKN